MLMDFILGIFKLYIERFSFFFELLIQHIMLSAIAILFTTIIGITLGIYITRNKKIASIVLGVNNFIYTIPSIALFGFLVAISGIGNTSALIALTVYGVLPIIRNTYVGINEVDSQVIESAVAMGSTDRQLLFKVQLPLALPVIIAGFRIMVVMTIALAGIASFIGAGGLGVAIWRGITTNFPEMTAAGSILVALLAVVVDYFLGLVEKKAKSKAIGTRKKGDTK
jgi:osmoprotectant transport system permease protein